MRRMGINLIDPALPILWLLTASKLYEQSHISMFGMHFISTAPLSHINGIYLFDP